MASIYINILSSEELHYLNNLPEVLIAKASLDSQKMVYFSVAVTESIRVALQTQFDLNIPKGSLIPMRWIKGDTSAHIDSGPSHFKNTYLVYLNDSPGELVIDSQSYPIEANTAFVFNEGLSHKTQGTENSSRLLIGPMNEFTEPVGASGIYYYPTEANALNGTNLIQYSASYIVSSVSGYTSWRIASNSSGSSPQSVVYVVEDEFYPDGRYNLYPAAPCFLEGSTVLCQVDGVEKYVPVEEVKKGTLVKTSLDGYKSVVLVGKGSIQNPGNDERIENRLYKCSPSKYPELKEDLYITGCHSILEFPLTDKQKEDSIKHLGRLFVTDKKHRLMACVDERAEPWNSEGVYTIWHFALENNDDKMNYGVYANGGLLVESCNIFFLKNKSNMDCIF